VFLVRAGTIAAVIPALVRALPLPIAMRLVDAGVVPLGLPGDDRLIRLTDGLLRLGGPLRPNCVVRSAVLRRYLGGTVRFGVKRGEDLLDGHAWVERDGEPVAEARDPRPEYRVVYSWPA
jgi:hypothetical protein